MNNNYEDHNKEKAIYKHYPGSERVIVFIHGIIEGPKQFRRLAQIAYKLGYAINILLLPGHGGNGHIFARTSYKQWVNYVSRQVKQMKAQYKEVILVGHSMGALLTLCEAVANDNKIIAIVLMDIPIKVHLWPRVIEGAIKIGVGDIKPWEGYTRAEYGAISVGRTSILGYLGWLDRYCELFTLIRYSKKQIHKIQIPILLVFANKDEFVSLKSKRYFENNSFVMQEVILEDSGHFCYNHHDLVKLEKVFKDFIRAEKKKINRVNVYKKYKQNNEYKKTTLSKIRR